MFEFNTPRGPILRTLGCRSKGSGRLGFKDPGVFIIWAEFKDPGVCKVLAEWILQPFQSKSMGSQVLCLASSMPAKRHADGMADIPRGGLRQRLDRRQREDRILHLSGWCIF